MAPVARVAVEKTTCRFDKLFDYAIPQGMPLRPGVRVLVPFGHGRRIGLVVELAEQAAHAALKPIAAPLEEEPVLTEEGLFLLRWLRENTFCTWFDALSVLIPAGYGLRGLTGWSLVRGAPVPEDLSLTEQQALSVLRPRRKPLPAADLAEILGLTLSALPLERLENLGLLRREEVVERRVGDKTLQMVRLTEAEPEKLTPKQQQVYELLGQVGCGSIREVCYFAGVTRGVVEKLVQQGLAETYEQEVLRTPLKEETIPVEPPPTLTEEQAAAVETLWQGCREGGRTGLLYGVTGSGKTAVYISLIYEALREGKSAILLVPEISLTPQLLGRLAAHFGEKVAVLHSSLRIAERFAQWRRIRDGEARVVVGTRSAVFAPVRNLGLLILDEEQEHTYRSESAPRYSAHEVARQRAAENGALLLLASATPSTESFHAAQNGRTQLVRLTKRYGGNPLPSVQIVDMRAELAAGNPREISLALEDAIRRNLEAEKQTILLLNRRGYQTIAQCEDCREVLKCPKCSVPMVYHKSAHKVLCHYCGSQQEPPPTLCPACGGKLQYRGFGTQKAEEELAKLFPEARVLRMDQDSTAAKDAHEKLLAKFAAHEYDIMVGTQMVAKGLDFEDVTLVGVLGIDSLLFAQGFRAYENVFSLITQVVGRSGRAKEPGFAIIQTTDPDNPVLTLAAAQDYDAFYEQEIAYRKLGLYPPFCGLCIIGFAGAKENEVARAAARFSALLGQQAAKQPDLPLRILGPTPGSIEKINDTYRYKLTVKCRNDRRFRDLVRSTLALYEKEKLPSKASVVVDLHSDGDI